MNRRRLLRIGLVGIGVALGALALGAAALSQALRPVDVQAPTQDFVVPHGAGLSRVASELERRGLIRSAWALEIVARWQGRAGALRAGEYELSPRLSAPQVLEQIVRGRVKTWEVVLPEGITAPEVAARLGRLGLARPEAFLALAHDPATAVELGVEGPTLEGYLFPETYRFARGLSERNVARRMVEQFQRVWAPLAEEAAAQRLSMREVVTLASIVEKETGAPQERALIAGVFRNRLARGMRLESDPTVIYGIADFDGNLRRVHLEDATNPYNTYQLGGLPPGPIASPGADALRAVLRPAETDFLFFVSRNDGTHVFSKTYAEHARAVDRYQRR